MLVKFVLGIDISCKDVYYIAVYYEIQSMVLTINNIKVDKVSKQKKRITSSYKQMCKKLRLL